MLRTRPPDPMDPPAGALQPDSAVSRMRGTAQRAGKTQV